VPGYVADAVLLVGALLAAWAAMTERLTPLRRLGLWVLGVATLIAFDAADAWCRATWVVLVLGGLAVMRQQAKRGHDRPAQSLVAPLESRVLRRLRRDG
jgi:hypothetical protein